MTDVAEQLVVSLEARVTAFEKAFERASATAAKNFDSIERRSRQSTARLEADMARAGGAAQRLGAGLKSISGEALLGVSQGALLALAPILSVTAALNGTREALDQLGNINDKSNAAGLDPELLQGVAHGAQLVGVEFDTTAEALATFAKNSGQAEAGTGRMYSQLQKLNPALLESIRNAKDQGERLRLAADAINAAGTASEKAALSATLFGDAGIKLAPIFEGGGAALDQMTAKAKDAGLVFDRDLVSRADDMGDQLDTLSQKVDVQLKTAFVNLGPVILGLTGLIGDWLRDLNIVLDDFKAVEDRTVLNPLQNQLIDIENRRATLLEELAGLKGQLADLDPASGMAGTITGEINEKAAQAEQLMQQALQYQERIDQIQGKPMSGSAPTPTPADGGSLSSPISTFDFRSVLDTNATGFGKVRDAAKDSALSIAKNSDAVSQLQDRFQRYENFASSFSSTFISDMEQGRGAVQALADAFGGLADQLLKAAADDTIKSLFANLLGGAASIASGAAIPAAGFVPGLTGPRLFSDGGYTGDGKRLQPAGVVHKGEYVFSAAATRRAGVGNLEAMHAHLRGFATGGYVGAAPALRPANDNDQKPAGMTVTISAPVTVNGSSGTPEQNADLARQTAAALEGSMRRVVVRELLSMSRPGNFLNRRN